MKIVLYNSITNTKLAQADILVFGVFKRNIFCRLRPKESLRFKATYVGVVKLIKAAQQVAMIQRKIF